MCRPVSESPEPTRLLNDWPLMMRLVVLAVAKEEYEVEEEYPNERIDVVAETPAEG